MDYDDLDDNYDPDEERNEEAIMRKLEAINDLRRSYGPPEDYPPYSIDGIILSTN